MQTIRVREQLYKEQFLSAPVFSHDPDCFSLLRYQSQLPAGGCVKYRDVRGKRLRFAMLFIDAPISRGRWNGV